MAKAGHATTAAMWATLASSVAIFGPSLTAQHTAETSPTKSTPPARQQAHPDENGAAKAPTHSPHPELPPLIAWQFVKDGNQAYVESRQREAARRESGHSHAKVTKSHHANADATIRHVSPQPKRPAGAGKYVCAVVTCADVDVAIAPILGLDQKDVLVLRLAGPFINPEAVAFLDRTIKKHRVSLVLMLGHENCAALASNPKGETDALDKRIQVLRQLAGKHGGSLAKALVNRQRMLLLASSETLGKRVTADRLRIMPGLIDKTSGAISWQLRRAQELPLSPVK